MSAQPVPFRSGSSLPSVPARVQPRVILRYVLASLAVLIPCSWQPRIQGGDLSSHIYNSWLASLIEQGRLSGLQIAHQTTNVLFDLLLTALFQRFGADWAQRLLVSLCVLILVWGAYAFVSSVSARAAWPFLPCITMLSYGWVFHMGFFNFYLSLGLSFWGLAVLWKPNLARIAGACALFAVAYTAHAVPVLWAAALLAYGCIARAVTPRARLALVGTGVALLVGAHFVARRWLTTNWSFTQLASAAGADQVLVFDGKYGLVMAALLLIWVTCFSDLLRTHGGRDLVRGNIPLHWCALTAAGIFLVPDAVLIPGYPHGLVYIAERMSLCTAVCLCAVLAAAPVRALQRYAFLVVALAFFACLFRDERSLNRFEDRIDRALAQLPPGQRVVSPILDPTLRVNALVHMIDRACIGRCFSYANYEPSTALFRIRATAPNPYVISAYGDSFDMQNGKYVFKPADLPVYALTVSDSGELSAYPLKPGVPSGATQWRALQTPATLPRTRSAWTRFP